MEYLDIYRDLMKAYQNRQKRLQAEIEDLQTLINREQEILDNLKRD